MNSGRRSIQYALDGALGGLVLAFAQTITASASKHSALYPFDAAASTLLGRSAVVTPSAASLLLGLLVYATFSALGGLAYHHKQGKVALSRLLTSSGRLRPTVSGILFGLIVWAVMTTVGRFGYPWLYEVPFLYSWWMFAFFFGLPLGMLAARTERSQPVELKIVYSAEGDRSGRQLGDSRDTGRDTPPSNTNGQSGGNGRSAANRQSNTAATSPNHGQPRPGGTGHSGWRRHGLHGQKRPSLRLLVNSHDPKGHDGQH